MLLFRSPKRAAARPRALSSHERTIARLAPKMSRAFETAALATQRRIDLDVLTANVEAGRIGRVIRQLDLDTFVTTDVVPMINFIADAYDEGWSNGKIRKADLRIGQFLALPVTDWPTHQPEDVIGTETKQVQINSLIPTQDIVDSRGPGVSTPSDPIDVYVRDGKMFIGDGHHRAIQELKAGKQTISANVTYLRNTPAYDAAHISQKPSRLGIDLKTTNPKALAAAERQAADLLTSVNVETKQTVRDLIARAYREQVSPRDTARMIRDVVGLNDRQANALFNYRAGLVEDGRAADQIERMTEKYGNRLLRQRADTIAQTEIHRASAEGQHELWREGVREGRINAATAVRIWIANVGACAYCEAIETINADGVPIDGQFETPDGDMIDGPEDSHVGCRCSTGLETE